MDCGWYGTIDAFLKSPNEGIISSLSGHYRRIMDEAPAKSQISAWEDCCQVLHQRLLDLVTNRPPARDWKVVFEYELPREGGRRPDVVLLAGGSVLVLEFKEKSQVEQADIDQVTAYARDLANYHEESHGHQVEAILVPTRRREPISMQDAAHIIAPNYLATYLSGLECPGSIDDGRWVESDYAPLPSLVQAARRIFNQEPLPAIKRARSAKIEETIGRLVRISDEARVRGERHLILVTGVPGAGKTLVGLKFVHENYFGAESGKKPAVFLSGNGPLVEVLQYALRDKRSPERRNKVFVQGIKKFIGKHGAEGKTPKERVLVFDEAQRAWDENRVTEKHPELRYTAAGVSEPEMLVKIAERFPDYGVIVGLIGEEQEIYVGEEAGIGQWNDAIGNSSIPWYVHGPEHLASTFRAACEYESDPLLNLTTSLRTHLAEDVQKWVRLLLLGHIESASSVSDTIRAQGFTMYVTRNLKRAKSFVRQRYDGELDKRYGLLASSQASLEHCGIETKPRPGWRGPRFNVGQWYEDEPDTPTSCCALSIVATEFESQGLELDLPIVCWGHDVLWQNSGWKVSARQSKKLKDPDRLRINSYRVLLSRGRDGFVIFVPNDEPLSETYSVLLRAGVRELHEDA